MNRAANPLLPDEIGLDETPLGTGAGNSVDTFHSVYGKAVGAGTVELGEYDAAFNTGREMYDVVVKAVPEPSSALLVVAGVFGLLGRRSRSRMRSPV